MKHSRITNKRIAKYLSMSEEEKRKMVIDTMISHGYSLEIRYDSESDLYNGTFVELTDEPKIYGKSLVEISNKFHSIIEQRFGGD